MNITNEMKLSLYGKIIKHFILRNVTLKEIFADELVNKVYNFSEL